MAFEQHQSAKALRQASKNSKDSDDERDATTATATPNQNFQSGLRAGTRGTQEQTN